MLMGSFPRNSRSSDSDLLYDEMTSAGPTMELSTLSGFQTSQFRNVRASCLQDSRNRIPKCRWTFLSGSNSRISTTHPPMMDGPRSFRDFMKSNARCPPVLLIPEIPTCKMPMALDRRHVSQLMDGPDSVSGFRDLRFPDVAVSLSTQNPGSRNTDGFLISATCLNRWTVQIKIGIFTMK
jgi:hypothetical protein